MPRWKKKDPSVFPVHFADVVEEALACTSIQEHSCDGILLHTCSSLSSARSYRDRFREWRRSLREWGNPSHRCFAIERDYAIKTFTREALGVISIYVKIEPRLTDLLISNNPELKGILP